MLINCAKESLIIQQYIISSFLGCEAYFNFNQFLLYQTKVLLLSLY